MRLQINKRTWTIRDAELDSGNIGESCETDRIIEIDPRQRSRSRLGTLIHELIHAIEPEFSEERVLAMEKVLASGLWRDRWRRRKK